MRNLCLARPLVAPAGFHATEGGVEVAAAVADEHLPTHDPPLVPRDEAAFLLSAAAEIEHMLMVVYLYAAYSLRPHGARRREIESLQNGLLQIAREEMGHLMTVQNLLLLIGAPLNFHREHSPYASEIYPFRFKLEPVSARSLAKYVMAESPQEPPQEMSEQDRALLKEKVAVEAKAANDDHPVMHVGPIFARLRVLFAERLHDDDFRHPGDARQGRYADWGYDAEEEHHGERLIVETFEGATPAEVRAAAVEAIEEIGEQGEGFDQPTAGGESHFERFFQYYKQVVELNEQGVHLTWPLPTNPNTREAPPSAGDAAGEAPHNPMAALLPDAMLAASEEEGRITEPRSRRWAQLFNLRYRLLLQYLSHFLHLEGDLYESSEDVTGDRTPRGLLLIWTFHEMRRIRRVARKLVQLPKDSGDGPMRAGPPFELPYSLRLPRDDADRWRLHLDTSRAASALVRALRAAGAPDDEDEFLADVERLDAEDRIVLRALASGDPVPAGALPTDFRKTVHILEEAVRGFSIGVHGNFWDARTRDELVDDEVFGERLISADFDPGDSALVNRTTSPDVRRRMPRHRPPVASERIAFLRQWIGAGAPDNDPAGKPGIVRERAPRAKPPPAEDPPADRPLGFAADIQPLFRLRDRDVMLAIARFDLHRLEDVRQHAEAIFERLDDGSMPCDGSWPADRIATFRRWIDQGMAP